MQIDTLISKEDAYLAGRVAGDWGAFHARLAASVASRCVFHARDTVGGTSFTMQSNEEVWAHAHAHAHAQVRFYHSHVLYHFYDWGSHAALDEANSTARARHAKLVAEEGEFERLQAANNDMQELAIEALDTNLSETKSAVDEELESLKARQVTNTATLAALQKELDAIQMNDHKDVETRVATRLAALKTKLETDIGTEHTLMRSKLHHDVQKLREEMNLLRSMAGSEQDQISSDLGYERTDQDDTDAAAATRQTKQETVMQKGETYLDDKIGVLLTGLSTEKEKLESEMARIAAERRSDEAAWRNKVSLAGSS